MKEKGSVALVRPCLQKKGMQALAGHARKKGAAKSASRHKASPGLVFGREGERGGKEKVLAFALETGELKKNRESERAANQPTVKHGSHSRAKKNKIEKKKKGKVSLSIIRDNDSALEEEKRKKSAPFFSKAKINWGGKSKEKDSHDSKASY